MTYTDPCTTDLAQFGTRELATTAALLRAYTRQGTEDPRHRLADGVTVMHNRDSGYVFLTDDDLNVAMLDDSGVLTAWLFTPYDGREGFPADLLAEYLADPAAWHPDDVEHLASYVDIPGLVVT